MGYDNASDVKIVTPELATEAAIAQRATEDYKSSYAILINQIADAQKKLDGLTIQITSQQKVYDGLYDAKTLAMQSVIDALQSNIDQLKQISAKLDQEILDKQEKKEAIQSDFSAKQADLDAQREQLKKQADSLGEIQRNQELKEQVLANQTSDLIHAKVNFESVQSLQNNKFINIQADLNQKQTEYSRLKSELDNQAHQQAVIDANLKQREDALLKSLADAQIIVDQAKAVEAQKVENETKAQQLAIQQAQLAIDINQTKATMVALDLQKADQAARQLVIEAAEKKIATGGHS